ncbi:MAG: ABC transporter ATP-binding protein [Planctomycetota bacterium]|jgi:sodium transport system ATP-binding protein|nr:ABC transporter ATP-binding protein [Planctomycetota bacterium]
MIEVVDLVKDYRAGDGSVVRAVDGISLHVAAGETVGLLGANGAGKTTTLRVLATLLKPTSGTARVAGYDVVADPVGVRRNLGYVSATTGVPDRLTPREIFTSFGRLHGLDRDATAVRVEHLLDALDLASCADRPAGRLSSGQRQRISLGRALVHDPPALVLDEPTNALDVLGARDLLAMVGQLRAEGHAILISTHRLHEIEHRCDRFVIVHMGRIVATGTRDALVADGAGLEDAFFVAVSRRVL